MKLRFFHQLFISHIFVSGLLLTLIVGSTYMLLPNLLYQLKIQQFEKIGSYLILNPSLVQPSNGRDVSLHIQLIKKNVPIQNTPNPNASNINLGDSDWAKLNKGEKLEFRQDRQHFSIPMTVLIMPVQQDEALLIASPLNEIEIATKELQSLLWKVTAILMLSVFFISILLARRLQSRISTMREMTRIIADGEFGKQIPVKGQDEIADLAHDLNRMSQNLEITSKEVERLELLRSQLFADLSHEIKTPLTSIRGWIEALRNGYIQNDQQQRVYFMIENETLRLIRRVQTTMDLERLRSGQAPLQYKTIDLCKMVEQVTDQMRILADEQELQLTNECSGSHHNLTIMGDEDRLRQVLINLLKNALQFTSSGLIKISCSADADEVRIEVEDTGIGMTPEEQKLIFDRFYKVDPSRSLQRGEMGLGLSLVKAIVEAHNGKIELTSIVQQGSIFRVILPRLQ